ncbi:MAG: caspase family protein, partial [Proteobacteria bacterium]|nr:caspase family protein [Pseudomonadota bacterium]
MKVLTKASQLFLTVSLVLACTSFSYAAKSFPTKGEDGKVVGLYKGSYALIIGVSDYNNGWPKLPGVIPDVEAVEDALKKNGFHVETVMDPDKAGMDNAFESFIKKYGGDYQNRLVFYFAGHGYTVTPKYGGDPLGYIVPKEAPNPHKEPKEFKRIAMSMQRIEEYSLNIDAKHAMFLFDSCFSGSLFSLSRAIPENINYKTAKPVRQYITSGSEDEKVPDKSVFRRQFISALEGEGDVNKDGYITGTELGEFLQSNVVNYSKGAQHPQYGKIRNPNLDKGDFVFLISSAKTAASRGFVEGGAIFAEAPSASAETSGDASTRGDVEETEDLPEEPYQLPYYLTMAEGTSNDDEGGERGFEGTVEEEPADNWGLGRGIATDGEKETWAIVRDSDDADVLYEFLTVYPDGEYAPAADNLIKQLSEGSETRSIRRTTISCYGPKRKIRPNFPIAQYRIINNQKYLMAYDPGQRKSCYLPKSRWERHLRDRARRYNDHRNRRRYSGGRSAIGYQCRGTGFQKTPCKTSRYRGGPEDANKAVQMEKDAWQKVKNSKAINDYRQFLFAYPNGQYALPARLKLRSHLNELLTKAEAEDEKLTAITEERTVEAKNSKELDKKGKKKSFDDYMEEVDTEFDSHKTGEGEETTASKKDKDLSDEVLSRGLPKREALDGLISAVYAFFSPKDDEAAGFRSFSEGDNEEVLKNDIARGVREDELLSAIDHHLKEYNSESEGTRGLDSGEGSKLGAEFYSTVLETDFEENVPAPVIEEADGTRGWKMNTAVMGAVAALLYDKKRDKDKAKGKSKEQLFANLELQKEVKESKEREEQNENKREEERAEEKKVREGLEKENDKLEKE